MLDNQQDQMNSGDLLALLGVGTMGAGSLAATGISKPLQKSMDRKSLRYWDQDGYQEHLNALLGKEAAKTGTKINALGNMVGHGTAHYEPNKNRVFTSTRGLPLAMHELGHAQQAKAGYKPYRAIDELQRLSGEGGIKKHIGRAGNMVARPLLDLFTEADAWKRAFKMTERPSLKKAMWKTAIPAYGSYLAKGLSHGAGLGMIGYGIYDSLTSND